MANLPIWQRYHEQPYWLEDTRTVRNAPIHGPAIIQSPSAGLALLIPDEDLLESWKKLVRAMINLTHYVR